MKIHRHAKIIEIIGKHHVETQEELSDFLLKEGIHVTQATISRDIRDLKLTKIPYDDGKQCYGVHNNLIPGLSEKYVRILRDGFLSMEMAQNILVVKTVSGMAMAVAAAIDSMKWSEVVGCIAGDDTIMCAVRGKDETIIVMEKIRRIVL
ncbi:MAG: arginine repressor [Lachnospiraceae bacterium]|jgi:transcriptional regulator of arginine metabolism|nr:arginine repressor [Lachnospiraceae bacterium]